MKEKLAVFAASSVSSGTAAAVGNVADVTIYDSVRHSTLPVCRLKDRDYTVKRSLSARVNGAPVIRREIAPLACIQDDSASRGAESERSAEERHSHCAGSGSTGSVLRDGPPPRIPPATHVPRGRRGTGRASNVTPSVAHTNLRTRRTGCSWIMDCAYSHAAMGRSGESSDEELMIMYRDGDPQAFDRLYDRHKGGLYRYLLRHCRESATAEELFQDVWMNLIRARTRYEASAKFATYLYRLAHNRLVDRYRTDSRGATVSFDGEGESEIEDLVAPGHEQPDAAYDTRRRLQRFMNLLARLPPVQREAFVLQHEAGMTVEEIATTTGVSRETAKSRLRYALAKLRQGMS